MDSFSRGRFFKDKRTDHANRFVSSSNKAGGGLSATPMLGWGYPPVAPGGGRGAAGEPGRAQRRVCRTHAHADGGAAARAGREPIAESGGVARSRRGVTSSCACSSETASPSGRGRAQRG